MCPGFAGVGTLDSESGYWADGVVAAFDFDGAEVAEGGVSALAVVEDLDAQRTRVPRQLTPSSTPAIRIPGSSETPFTPTGVYERLDWTGRGRRERRQPRVRTASRPRPMSHERSLTAFIET